MTSTNRYPPGPKARYPLELQLAFRRDRLGFLKRLASFGDVSYLRIRGDEFFLINHPDLIRDVLVTHNRSFVKSRVLQFARRLLGDGLLTSEGDFHLRQRRLVQPAFHRQRMVAYGQVMTQYAARTAARWEVLGDGTPVDMAAEMMRLTLAIVGKTLFDADVEQEAPEIGRALTEELRAFNRLFLPLGEQLEQLPLPSSRRARAGRKRLDQTIYRMIAERREGGRIAETCCQCCSWPKTWRMMAVA